MSCSCGTETLPLHPDFQRIKDKMVEKYGKDKGTRFFYAWVNKHGYDDTKPFPGKLTDELMVEILAETLAIESPDIKPIEPKVFPRKDLPSWGLYLVPPHARYIAEGLKNIIVKSKEFHEHTT